MRRSQEGDRGDIVKEKSLTATFLKVRSTVFCSTLFSLVLSISPAEATAENIQNQRGVQYLTLRDRIDAEEGYFGSQRSSLKAGSCIVDQLSLDFLSKAAEIAPFRSPEEILSLERIEEKPIERLMTEFAEETRDAPVLYIHGYYIDFSKGCRRATVFKENAGLEGKFLWFSWPSDGSLVNYARDEVNLYWSVPELAGTIVDLHDRFGSGNVDLAGHSLGGRGLVLALYEVAATRPDLRFGEVVLLAPDMDFDIFRKLLPRVRPLVQSITVYTSDADKALDVSEQVHGYPRLGQSGNEVEVLTSVEVVDVSELTAMSTNGHLYHIYNKEVGADLSQLLNQGKPANERSGLERVGSNLWKVMPNQ